MKKAFLIFITITISLLALSACGHKHKFGEWQTTVEPTCTEEGKKIQSCECGEVKSEKVQKKSHDTTLIDAVAPTCFENGYTQGTYCNDCAAYIEEPVLIPPMHNYVSSVSVTPTCSSIGCITYVCSECQSEYVEEIDELGHDYKNATCTTVKKCKTCGYSVGLVLGHTEILGICERCNEFVQPTVSLPAIPINTAVEINDASTLLQVTNINYRFTETSLILTYSGTKIADGIDLENGTYFCGFSYRLYDTDGILIANGTSTVFDLAVGDKIKDKIIVIDNLTDLSECYILVIEDYKQ